MLLGLVKNIMHLSEIMHKLSIGTLLCEVDYCLGAGLVLACKSIPKRCKGNLLYSLIAPNQFVIGLISRIFKDINCVDLVEA